ncbi:small multi-drug export protein [Bacillus piscicola]|uniref:small multi-drug export protein n=1 Tax=Bacillus piscicola TaxID=1632684 RepID=UPI001F08C12E|nr:small multi-drug export protein [Bacillus piscicola]
MFLSYLFVFVLAAIPLFELVAVIPLAIIGGLSPLPTAILAFLGNALTVILLIVFVDHVKKWKRKRQRKRIEEIDLEEGIEEDWEAEKEESKKGKRARALFDKYGLPGLTIIGPFFVGSHISAFMGMSFGSKRKMVTSWMMVSLLLWTVVTAVASRYGVTYFMPNVEEDGFLIRLFSR